MKNLSVTHQGGQVRFYWTEQEIIDIFASDPGNALDYVDILDALRSEYDAVSRAVASYKSRAKGTSEIVTAAKSYQRILFFKIRQLKRLERENRLSAKQEEKKDDASGFLVMGDLMEQFDFPSHQAAYVWIKKHRDEINRVCPEPIQKVGKSWRIPKSALPYITRLRQMKYY